MSRTWGPAPTPWESHTWAQGAASPPPCLPQNSVSQKLFGVTERLFGSTEGMRGTFLYSVPKTRNKYICHSLGWVVAVDFGDIICFWVHFEGISLLYVKHMKGCLRDCIARLQTGLLATSAFWCPLEGTSKPCQGEAQPRACAGPGKWKTLVAVVVEHVTSQTHRDTWK